MRVYTLSDMRSENKLRVYTASEAKGLRAINKIQFTKIDKSSYIKIDKLQWDVYFPGSSDGFRNDL